MMMMMTGDARIRLFSARRSISQCTFECALYSISFHLDSLFNGISTLKKLYRVNIFSNYLYIHIYIPVYMCVYVLNQ